MIRATKWAIWLYLFLLLFEGALRKWVMPGYSAPLLIVRDPVLLLIYVMAAFSGRLPRSRFLIVMGVLAGASFLFASLAGQGNFWVTLYGIRCNFLHVPLIWVMAEVMDREDVERMGFFIVLMAIPMTALMIMQFKAAPDHMLNRGVGEDEIGQIYGAAGHIRPPGFFTFITGPMVYFPLAAAFFLNEVAMEKPRLWRMLILIVAGLAIAVALPISISRGTMISTVLVLAVFLLCLVKIGILNSSFLRFASMAAVVLLGLSFLPIFDEARHVFMDRWDTAAQEAQGDAFGSLTRRVMGIFTQPVETIERAPTFGHGIGVGTNVGARLLSGSVGFLLAEDEWGRAIMELGPMLGISYIIFRIALTFSLAIVAWRALISHRDPLPSLIFAASASVIMLNQWGQPTQLGFAVMGGGLLLAAVNYKDDEEEDDEEWDDDDEESDADDEDAADDDGDEEVAVEESMESENPAMAELEARRRRMRGL